MGEFDGDVELIGRGEVLTREDIAEIQKQLIYMYDAQTVLYEAVGNKKKARDQKTLKEGVLVSAAMLNSLEDDYLTNQQINEADKIIRGLGKVESPGEFLSEVERLRETIEVIATINDEGEDVPADAEEISTEADADVERLDDIQVPAAEEVLGEWDQLIEALNGDYSDPAEMVEAVGELLPELSFAQDAEGEAFIQGLTTVLSQADAVEAGEATMILFPQTDADGNYIGHELSVIPMKESQQLNPETGEFEDILVPDISVLGPDQVQAINDMDYDASTLPEAQMAAADGVERVPVIPARLPYDGVKMLAWTDNIDDEVTEELFKLGLTEDQINRNGIISEDALSALASDPNAIPFWQASGVISEDVPFVVQQVRWNEREFYLDQLNTPEGVQGLWHEDNLPYIARSKPVDGLERFHADYFGGDITLDGRVWIDYTGLDESDDTDTGSHLINLGVTSQQARDDIVINGGVPETVYARDPNDPAVGTAIAEDDPRHPMNPVSVSLTQYLRDEIARVKKIADKVASTLPPEEAAETAFLEKFEIEELGRARGVDRDGNWVAGVFDVPDQAPGSAVMSELGINQRGQETPEDQPQQFDHTAAARAGAESINKRYLAERRARLEAAKAAQAEAAKKSVLPTIKATPLPAPGVKGFDPKSKIDAAKARDKVDSVVAPPAPKPTPPPGVPTVPENPFRKGRAV
jgi:hypothetical protein